MAQQIETEVTVERHPIPTPDASTFFLIVRQYRLSADGQRETMPAAMNIYPLSRTAVEQTAFEAIHALGWLKITLTP